MKTVTGLLVPWSVSVTSIKFCVPVVLYCFVGVGQQSFVVIGVGVGFCGVGVGVGCGLGVGTCVSPQSLDNVFNTDVVSDQFPSLNLLEAFAVAV